MDRLQLALTHYDAIIAHLRTCYPEEGCGLVGGVAGCSEQVIPVENRLHSPVAYEMEPLAQIRAMLALEAAGQELVAIFHSHPNGPLYPSPSDVAQAYYPETMQIIVSMVADPGGPPAMAGFMIKDGEIARATLQIAESSA